MIVIVFSPVLGTKSYLSRRKKILEEYGSDSVILNFGSGPSIIDKRTDIINVDIFDFKNVDIVADVSGLPIHENSVDLILNFAMLEHVNNPQKIVNEMKRILSDDGRAICYLPFMVPFHAAPHDFMRWTRPGVVELFSSLEIIEIGIGSGPTSGMLCGWCKNGWRSFYHLAIKPFTTSG